MARFNPAADISGELVFDPVRTLDAIRFHIREIRHVRDFVGSESVLRQMRNSGLLLRIPADKWKQWKDIRRLLWLLDESGIGYRMNAQNIAVFAKAASCRSSRAGA